jgi:Flp pilus assembly protein TadG
VRSTTRTTRALRGEEGAAAVEFALISTVLFLLIFGILEFGQAYSQYQVFQGAAREGARLASVGTPASQVVTRVSDAADPFKINGRPGVSVSVEGGGNECTSTNRGKKVTVKWRQVFDIQLPFVPPIDTRTWISAVFRCE